MRIYEGSPRQDFEEVFRSIGAFLDGHGMRDILLLEVPDGFIVQGLAAAGASSSAWSETVGVMGKETLSFLDEDIAKFMEEAAKRRGNAAAAGAEEPVAGLHEQALRVIGHWIDQQKPKDVFLFEQEGAYVVRLNMGGQAGVHHELAEFTRDDVEGLVAQAPSLRNKPSDPAG
jgi:hypothetical protein